MACHIYPYMTVAKMWKKNVIKSQQHQKGMRLICALLGTRDSSVFHKGHGDTDEEP